MSRLIKIGCGLVVGAALGVAASFVGVYVFGGSNSSAASKTGRLSPGRLTPTEVMEFRDFPLYGGIPQLEGIPLLRAKRVSPQSLAEAARVQPPVVTVGRAPNQPESRGHRMVPDFVNLVYGSCPPAPAVDSVAAGLCSAPLQVQIWRSCNRSLDDYEMAPGVALPHTDLTVRGTKAADFGDRLELYAGSVTIVIFAEHDLAMRAAGALRPLNGLAVAEANRAANGQLPASSPGPECA
jgi:hypothetical protein